MAMTIRLIGLVIIICLFDLFYFLAIGIFNLRNVHLQNFKIGFRLFLC